jgi:hypothetical protein
LTADAGFFLRTLLRANEIAQARERSEAERRGAERHRQAAEVKKHAPRGSKSLKQRGASSVCREIEREIERCNPTGYDNDMTLLFDLQALAVEGKPE